MKSPWRERSAQIIYKIIRDNPDIAIKELCKKISEAYPFGERKYHPYKIWLSEVKRATKREGKFIRLIMEMMLWLTKG